MNIKHASIWNNTYVCKKTGYWEMKRYDSNGRLIYYTNSAGEELKACNRCTDGVDTREQTS